MKIKTKYTCSDKSCNNWIEFNYLELASQYCRKCNKFKESSIIIFGYSLTLLEQLKLEKNICKELQKKY